MVLLYIIHREHVSVTICSDYTVESISLQLHAHVRTIASTHVLSLSFSPCFSCSLTPRKHTRIHTPIHIWYTLGNTETHKKSTSDQQRILWSLFLCLWGAATFRPDTRWLKIAMSTIKLPSIQIHFSYLEILFHPAQTYFSDRAKFYIFPFFLSSLKKKNNWWFEAWRMCCVVKWLIS